MSLIGKSHTLIKSQIYKCKILSNKFDVNVLPQKRNLNFLWAWLNNVFNRVDKNRLKTLGPDISCAEWILRNGGTVRFRNQKFFVDDYNVLMEMEELSDYSKYKIEEIFAQKAGLSYLGFEHLKNCEHIKKIRLIACHFLDNQCLSKLLYVKNSLEFLEIRSSYLVHDKGILLLSQLSNLKTLILADLPEVKKKAECEETLKKALSKCKILFE